jgi:hypothetical protein
MWSGYNSFVFPLETSVMKIYFLSIDIRGDQADSELYTKHKHMQTERWQWNRQGWYEMERKKYLKNPITISKSS